ncbi:unnamed protein product [Thlaspi arvense]|uniref:F-box/LRR-repeat protein 15/At3g58940/PEG3-like LRR domain-containing protein n=1 Tax=Thlaspi arvense TaxID=13288 RepID=A0AAU9S7F3_THLAR|nr:unnamed protein product [Thlaspi arvense]
MPRLDFDSCDHKGKLGTFSNNVCESLLSHKALVLESLHISFSTYKCDATEIGMWIGIAYAQHVRKLVLDVESRGGFELPRSLYNCEILETLRLKAGSFYLNDQVCLKSLKTLYLHPNSVISEASFVNLLSGCPNLENLVVHTLPKSRSLTTFTISVPSLLRLSISKQSNYSCSYVINAPSLKYLKIEANHKFEFRLIESVTNLVEAHLLIENASPMVSENLMSLLTSAKRLSLELLPMQVGFQIFLQSVELLVVITLFHVRTNTAPYALD